MKIFHLEFGWIFWVVKDFSKIFQGKSVRCKDFSARFCFQIFFKDFPKIFQRFFKDLLKIFQRFFEDLSLFFLNMMILRLFFGKHMRLYFRKEIMRNNLDFCEIARLHYAVLHTWKRRFREVFEVILKIQTFLKYHFHVFLKTIHQ